MKVAVIGAGRNQNGIGPYIARYFHENHARVLAVLGTTAASSHNAAAGLSRFGIRACAYTDFEEMVKREAPDAVVIASPMNTHHQYLARCVHAGMHVFCEKPFVWQKCPDMDINGLLDPIFDEAARRGVKIAMNSQWPFSLPFYEDLCGLVDAKSVSRFWMHLSPSAPGLAMIPDSVPHALSLLHQSLGHGKISGLVLQGGPGKRILRFVYHFSHGSCRSCVELVPAAAQPREFAYGFDDRIIRRKVDMQTYAVIFARDRQTLRIPDPLELSVRDFIHAVAHNTEPLVGRAHIYHNMNLLQQIYLQAKTSEEIS